MSGLFVPLSGRCCARSTDTVTEPHISFGVYTPGPIVVSLHVILICLLPALSFYGALPGYVGFRSLYKIAGKLLSALRIPEQPISDSSQQTILNVSWPNMLFVWLDQCEGLPTLVPGILNSSLEVRVACQTSPTGKNDSEAISCVCKVHVQYL